MAWYSYTMARTVLTEQAANAIEARELIMRAPESQPFIHTSSRNGVLLGTLKKISAHAHTGSDLYLLREQAIVSGVEIERQHACIGALLAEIERDPELVLEATKETYEPHGTIDAVGFQPLPYELIYPPNCTVKDNWVYFYTEERVRALLASALTAPDPKPAGDDEGESLAYVFGFLKSHAWLLRAALASGHAVIYAEMNP